MICSEHVEKLALPGETIGRCRIISLGISCIAHGVCGKGVPWISCPSSPFFSSGPFPFCHSSFTSSASLSTTRTVCGTGVAILLVSVLVREFGLFPLMSGAFCIGIVYA